MLKKALKWLFQRTTAKRTAFFLLADFFIISASCLFGFILRFDGKIIPKYYPMIGYFILLSAPIIIFLLWRERLYYISWSFVSVKELLRLLRAVTLGFLIIGAALFLLRDYQTFIGFPRSIIFISGLLALIMLSGLRFAKRIYIHGLKHVPLNGDKNKALIFGAGEAGEQLVRYMLSHNSHQLIGLIDDNPMKRGVLIHGIKVIGNLSLVPKINQKYNINEFIIAAPSAPKEIICRAVEIAREAGIKSIKILPGTDELLNDKVTLSNLRDIQIDDLLGRDKVEIDTEMINNFIKGKNVLITGGAGSIGSHLYRQLLKFKPNFIISLDNNETGSFYLWTELKTQYPDINKKFIVGDIGDRNKVASILNQYKPQVVFHAAAYKHVPLMEDHPDEAVKNNIFGTLILAEEAIKSNVEKFVFISTDKAINPTSMMGASKRVAEMVCTSLDKKGITKFCAVRFGNVLDSQGNVVGIFKNQIKKGGPVEITHPEMKRYFMVTEEACLLVMQASALGEGGEIFVLDMGEPIKIVDLAKEMIRLAGYQPDIDIPIVFTGIRPGEKLFEEILTKEECPTKHNRIYISKFESVGDDMFMRQLFELKNAAEANEKNKIIQLIQEIIPNANLSMIK
ncbi:polysaccharide biosynthesis protein [Candidatus Falkowbacteria bacterium]|nr:polysaccharide biosynthesis protein [Candidatus Falkowbacteria bacterium]